MHMGAPRTPRWASTLTTLPAALPARPRCIAAARMVAATLLMPQPAEHRHRRRRGPSLRIGSMNVRGICAPNRAQQLLRAWARKRYHIVLLQECKADLFSAAKVAAQLRGWRLYRAQSQLRRALPLHAA